ncbi:serine protease inhibitor 2-like [Anopheles darlingi]|uniref:serine protease inhibitor 2-like n=1 Tax=Anopheles darlingi TaxID=43151 RepID=UPI00210022CB|nr:serine protease inhibitor 2-like [Anopheles darlingi]
MPSLRPERCTIICCLLMALCSFATSRNVFKNRFLEEYQPYAGPWNDDFDWSLIKEILPKVPGNVVLSPISVKTLLALLYEGSATRSETQRELSRTLGIDDPQAVGKLQEDLRQYKSQTTEGLLITDRVFHNVSIPVTHKYRIIINDQYNASTEEINFGDPDAASVHINRWISHNTGGLIEDVVRADTLRETLLLLINTIYFRGNWVEPFPLNATAERPFYATRSTTPGKAIFMKQRERLFHHGRSEQLGAQILRLPYQQNQLAMIVVLPDEGLSLDQLLVRLTPDAVHRELTELSEEEIDLELPKFSIRYAGALREPLQRLGLTRIFSDQAELPLIARGLSTPLKVSTILQKSCIQVDEQGTQASAATESSLVFTILSEPVKFIANRPFLFLILDEAKGTWLFAGKVEDPSL